MATQKQIAAKLGISQKTVSRVINDSACVRTGIRETVLSEIQQCGYTLNISARNLRVSKTGVTGIIVPGKSAFHSIYFLKTFEGINEAARCAGYSNLVITLEKEKEIKNLLQPAAAKVDGFIIFNIGRTGRSLIKKTAGLLHETGKPAVIIQASGKDGIFPSAGIDNFAGGLIAGQHLIAEKCKNFAYLGYGNGFIENRQRLAGFKTALQNAHKKNTCLKVFPWNEKNIDSSINSMIKARQGRPAGIFAWSDRVARLVLFELKRLGFCVPGDFSIVGFDDLESYSLMTRPLLTTVRQPFYDLGINVMKKIIESINNPSLKLAGFSIKPELVIRDT